MPTSKSSEAPVLEFKNFTRPVPINSKAFRIRPLEPAEGSATNIKIIPVNGGAPMIVDRADVPELVADLLAAYQL